MCTIGRCLIVAAFLSLIRGICPVSHGTPVAAYSKPWHVIVNKPDAPVLNFFGGTIISHTRIVTAGHCQHNSSTPYVVFAGGVRTDGIDAIQVAMTNDFSVHPDYKGNVLQYDIGVLTLRDRLPFSSAIWPVAWDRSFSARYSSMVAIGNGWKEREVMSSISLRSDCTPVQHIHCSAAIGIEEGQMRHALCINHTDNSNLCRGDDGAGLVLDENLLSGVLVKSAPNCPSAFTVDVFVSTVWVTQWLISLLKDDDNVEFGM